MNLKTLTPILDAVVMLMPHLIEVVVHDLNNKTIAYINGQLSKRQIGNPSLLDQEAFETKLEEMIYTKLNFDGRLVKSISVRIDSQFLICINCDISIFETMQKITQQFLSTPIEQKPISLFKSDWQEALHKEIHNFLNEKKWIFNNLDGAQKKDVIHYLFLHDAFNEKHAVDYIAKVLTIGRSTIFKYLKEWKENIK